MTDTTHSNISDKQLADNVRAAATAFADAVNSAHAAGLAVEYQFIPLSRVGYPVNDLVPDVQIKRVVSEDL